MRNLKPFVFFFLSFVVFSAGIFAQAPQEFNYQAVLRDDAGQPKASENVTVELTILQEDADGTVVFSETHETQTNEFGLINLKVGSVNSLEDIIWDEDAYFIQVSVNNTPMGTTQLLSVPFALHAYSSADAFSGDYEDLENAPDLSAFVEIESPEPGDIVFYSNGGWSVIPVGQEGQVLQIKDGQPKWQSIDDDTFTCGEYITFTYNGEEVTYGTLELHGLCWMDRNLGASQVPTAMDDPEGYGDLFQWGRLDDGHQERNSQITSTLSDTDVPGHSDFIIVNESPNDWRIPQNDDLWDGEEGINNPCPPGWRLPTEIELLTEAATFNPEGAVGAFNSALKWPSAGGRNAGSGELDTVGEGGFVWSSDVSSTFGRALLYLSGIHMDGS